MLIPIHSGARLLTAIGLIAACGCAGGAGKEADARPMPVCSDGTELPATFEKADRIKDSFDLAFITPVKRYLTGTPGIAPHVASLESSRIVTMTDPTNYPAAWTRESEQGTVIEIDVQYIFAHRAAVELALVESGWFPEATGYRTLILDGYEQALSRDRICKREASPPGYLSSVERPEPDREDSFGPVFTSAVNEMTQSYLAYILAHEIAHKALGHASTRSSPAQEREADEWAFAVYAASGLPLYALTMLLQTEVELESIRERAGFHPDPSHPTWAERLHMAESLRSRRPDSDCVRLRGRMLLSSERGATRGPWIDMMIPDDLDFVPRATAQLSGMGGLVPVEGTARRAGNGALLQFRVGDDVYSMATTHDSSGLVRWSKTRVGSEQPLESGTFAALVYRGVPFETMLRKLDSACITERGWTRRALSKIGVVGAQRAAAEAALAEAETTEDALLSEHTRGELDQRAWREAMNAAGSRGYDALRRILGEQTFDAFHKEHRRRYSLALPIPQ